MTENEAKEIVKKLRNKAELFKNSGFAVDGIVKSFEDSANAIEMLSEEIQQYRAIGTIEEFRQAMRFKEYFMELYDEGLEVANWHKNGDLEPLVNFIDEACS